MVRWYIEELNEQTENDGPEPPGGESTIEFQSSSLGFPRSSDNQRPKSNGNHVSIVLMLRGLRNQTR